ncbi:hypothetical protein PoB_000788000 [Plakobranchus ocellatus]|uniref:Uncharacterized protein n=1 Tax=Plakobranchus ocellatus TaxID=259542 RepID=A0AAV3YF48_9GAST|nr:hypothetical protein PoB_000788000 [Plakobranchus ocellatus]
MSTERKGQYYKLIFQEHSYSGDIVVRSMGPTEYDKSREHTAVADLLFAHYNWPQHGGDAFCAEKPPVAGWAKGGQRSGRAV